MSLSIYYSWPFGLVFHFRKAWFSHGLRLPSIQELQQQLAKKRDDECHGRAHEGPCVSLACFFGSLLSFAASFAAFSLDSTDFLASVNQVEDQHSHNNKSVPTQTRQSQVICMSDAQGALRFLSIDQLHSTRSAAAPSSNSLSLPNFHCPPQASAPVQPLKPQSLPHTTSQQVASPSITTASSHGRAQLALLPDLL